jgi:hypothetical protein
MIIELFRNARIFTAVDSGVSPVVQVYKRGELVA